MSLFSSQFIQYIYRRVPISMNRPVYFQCIVFLCFICFSLNSQDTIFFSGSGLHCNKELADQYRITKTGLSTSYYIDNGKCSFNGIILYSDSTTEEGNKYSGECTWYFRNGNKKAIRFFNDKGLETGISRYFYENQSIWKEIPYKDGLNENSTYIELDEEGVASRVFEDNFTNNQNHWDLYNSNLSEAFIRDGRFFLNSLFKHGTSRHIYLPSPKTKEFSIETTAQLIKFTDKNRFGILFGFKDWENYHFFAISASSIYIGSVKEGIITYKADGIFSADIHKDASNVLKIFCNGNKYLYSINGIVQMNSEKFKMLGEKCGLIVNGFSRVEVFNLKRKEFNITPKELPASTKERTNKNSTGLLIHSGGYILAYASELKSQNSMNIVFSHSNTTHSFKAKLLHKDELNDMALLLITDSNYFKNITPRFNLPGALAEPETVIYSIIANDSNFIHNPTSYCIGNIASKTGVNAAINSYQAIFPNCTVSGKGFVFNDHLELLGLRGASTKTSNTDIYPVIKINYLNNLLDLLPEKITVPNSSQKNIHLTQEEKLKLLSENICIIQAFGNE